MKLLKNFLILLIIILLMGLVGGLGGCCNKKPDPLKEPIHYDTNYTQYAENMHVKD